MAGSATSWDHNPAFTVVDFDKELMVPVNVETWYMNLTEANLTPDQPPSFQKLHDFKLEYSLPDLSPSSFLDLSHRLY